MAKRKFENFDEFPPLLEKEGSILPWNPNVKNEEIVYNKTTSIEDFFVVKNEEVKSAFSNVPIEVSERIEPKQEKFEEVEVPIFKKRKIKNTVKPAYINLPEDTEVEVIASAVSSLKGRFKKIIINFY